MSVYLKRIFIALSAVILLSILLFIGYKQIENAKKMDDIQQSIIDQKQLIDNITRSSSVWANKDDFNKLLAAQEINLKAIQKDIDSLNGKLTGIQNITVVSKGQTTTNLPSTTTTANTTPIDPSAPDPYGYLRNTQNLQLNENFANIQVPSGVVSFSAAQEKPWGVSIPDRKYNVISVLAHDKEGKSLAYSKFSIESAGKSYDVQIAENKMVEEYPSASFSFNPRIIASVGAGVSLPTSGGGSPAISIPIAIGPSFFSYGKTKSEPDVLILRPFVSYDAQNKRVGGGISPVLFSVGKVVNVPILHNSFISPDIGIDTNRSLSVGVSLGVSF